MQKQYLRIFKILMILFVFLPWLNIDAQVSAKKISAFRDSTDNAYDISTWLINKKGILLVPSIITEPATGYGVAVAAVYFHSSYSKKNGPPSMSGVLGGATQNGTWAAALFHVGYWKQDRLRYMGGVVRTDANIGFYGSGYTAILANEPVNLNLNAWGLVQQLKGRIGNSGFFVGGRYLLFSSENTFEIPVDYPDYSGTEFNSTLSEASIIIDYDTRNNVFSPSKGFYISCAGTYSDDWFGGDGLYGRVAAEGLGWFPASKKVTIGLRYSSNYSIGDVPFWARPIVQMRGVPVMKYQNRNTTLMETEVSVDVFKRWSAIGFAGIGNAYESISDFEKGKSVRTAGTGFRYLLARKFGAKMGMDFAVSQDDFAFYFVFGSSWLR
jgi:hypothetical protein